MKNTTKNMNMANANKEDKNMANAQVQVIDFEFDGVRYTNTRPGYYYKKVEGKQTRIPKSEWEQAWDSYTAEADPADDWQIDDEFEARKQAQTENDKQTEDSFNKKEVKKTSRSRKSKDVAFEGVYETGNETNFKVNKITLTAKQVDFLKALAKTDEWKEVEQGIWCDVIADEIKWNPMSVGAMISTLREKNLIIIVAERINGKKCKNMSFTELGKKVATELGLA